MCWTLPFEAMASGTYALTDRLRVSLLIQVKKARFARNHLPPPRLASQPLRGNPSVTSETRRRPFPIIEGEPPRPLLQIPGFKRSADSWRAARRSPRPARARPATASVRAALLSVRLTQPRPRLLPPAPAVPEDAASQLRDDRPLPAWSARRTPWPLSEADDRSYGHEQAIGAAPGAEALKWA
jgi:hypothetical protein